MTEKKSYGELLRDPRWQRKRLEIMQRDEFRCAECSSTDKTLNVHHRHYVRGRAPWEYDDEHLVTLCEDCHVEVSTLLDDVKRRIGRLSKQDLEALQISLIDGYPDLHLSSEYLGHWPHVIHIAVCVSCADPSCVAVMRDSEGALHGWCPLFELAVRGDDRARAKLTPDAAVTAIDVHVALKDGPAFGRPEAMRRLALAELIWKGRL